MAFRQSSSLRAPRRAKRCAPLGLLTAVALLSAVAIAPAQSSAAYRDVVLADNPDSYFRMDEATTGTTMNNETAAADGTHVLDAPGPTFGLGGALSSETPNLSIGYLNDKADRSTFSVASYDAFTIEFIVFSPEPDPGAAVTQWWNGRGLVDGDIGAVQNDAGVSIIRSGHVGFGMGDTSTGLDTTIESSTPVIGGAWHHVVATSNGTGLMRLYVDGVFEAEDTTAPAANRTNTTFTIAQLQAPSPGNGQLAGALDEVAFYTHALTQTDVTEHYNAAFPPPPPPAPCRKVACMSAADKAKVFDLFGSIAKGLNDGLLRIEKKLPPKPVTVQGTSPFAGLFNWDFNWCRSSPGLCAKPSAAKRGVLGAATTAVSQPGAFTATFTFSKAGVKKLRKLKKANVTLTQTFTDTAGGVITDTTSQKYRRKKD